MYGYDSQSFLTTTGAAYSAGRDQFGKMGVGTTGEIANDFRRCIPVEMQLPVGVKAAELTTLDEHSISVLGSNGLPRGVGLNNTGQLGNGSMNNATVPAVPILSRMTIIY